MRTFMTALCALFLFTGQTCAAPRLLLLDFEIVDTSNEPTDHSADHERRLVEVRERIADALAKRGLYDVVDRAPIRAEIEKALAQQYFRTCNGCEITLARAAGADFVMLGKFNKISTLVGSMDIVIENVATGRPVYIQNFGFRGDSDEAWARAAEFFVGSLARKIAKGEAQ